MDSFRDEKKSFLITYASWLNSELDRCLPHLHSNLPTTDKTKVEYWKEWKNELHKRSIELEKLANESRLFTPEELDKEMVFLANRLKVLVVCLEDMIAAAQAERQFEATKVWEERFKPDAEQIREGADNLLYKLRSSLFPTGNGRNHKKQSYEEHLEIWFAEAINSLRLKVGTEGAYVSYPDKRVVQDIAAYIKETKNPSENYKRVKELSHFMFSKWLGEGWLIKNSLGQTFLQSVGKERVDNILKNNSTSLREITNASSRIFLKDNQKTCIAESNLERDNQTRTKRKLNYLKNHPVISLFILIGVIIIALWQFTQAIDYFYEKVQNIFFADESKIEVSPQENNLIPEILTTIEVKKATEKQQISMDSIPFNNKAKSRSKTDGEPEKEHFSTPEKLYIYDDDYISKGESFIDPLTGATLGVSKISYDSSINGNITLPGKATEDLINEKPGKIWHFSHQGKNYRIILKRVFYLGDYFSIRVEELKE